MKLDRNLNPDGKGKYALINLRKNTVEWGDKTQFFVIKYTDVYAEAALRAYATDVVEHARELAAIGDVAEAARLAEYADEIFNEADIAANYHDKKTPD